MLVKAFSAAQKNILCERLEVVTLANQYNQPAIGVVTNETPLCINWLMKDDNTLTLQCEIGNSAVLGGYLAYGGVGSIIILDNTITLGQFVTVQYTY